MSETPNEAARALIETYLGVEPKGTEGATRAALEVELSRLNRNILLVERGGQTLEGKNMVDLVSLQEIRDAKAAEIANWNPLPDAEYLSWAEDYAGAISHELTTTYSSEAMREAFDRSPGSLLDLLQGWQSLVLARHQLDRVARFRSRQVDGAPLWTRLKPYLPCQLPASSDTYLVAEGRATKPILNWPLVANLDLVSTLTIEALRQMPTTVPVVSSLAEIENSPKFVRV